MLPIVLACALGSCGREPEPPTAQVPRKVAPPAAPTLEERMSALAEKEKAASVAFRTLHEAWSGLLSDAKGTKHEAAILEKLESLEGRANRVYREVYRPVHAELGRLVAERNPTGARDRLRAWTVPPEMDIKGLRSADRERELETLEELIRLEACRHSLDGRYDAGDFTRDAETELNPFRLSPRVGVRTEAEKAVLALRQIRAVDLRRRRYLQAPEGGRFAFGERPGAPVPTERRFASKIPPAAKEALDESRKILALLAKTSTLKEFQSLAISGGANAHRAVQAAGWLPVAHYAVAEWRYVADGDTLGALLSLDEAIRLHPPFVEARLARTRLLVEAGLREQAGREMLLLRRALPDDLRTHLAAARRAFIARETDEAVRAIDQAFRALPEDPSFLRRVERSEIPEEPGWAAKGIALETATYSFRAEPSTREGLEARLKRLGDAAEAAHAWFPSIVKIEAKPDRKARVFLFSSEESYAEFADPDGEEALAGSGGKFFHDGRRIMLPDGEEAKTRRTLLHEAWHEYFGRSSTVLPTWLNEGLADYAGTAEIREGRVAGTAVSEGRLWTLDSGFRQNWPGLPFEEIMGASQREFYGTLRSLQYAQAWSMVQFFRHGEGGRYAGAFQSYLELLVQGTERGQAFERTLGKEDGPRMREEWRAYVTGLAK
jgi:tetratricopeptide (TPR) repeat protein